MNQYKCPLLRLVVVAFIVCLLASTSALHAQTLNVYSKGTATPFKSSDIRSLKFSPKVTVSSATNSTATTFDFAAIDSITVTSGGTSSTGAFALSSSAFINNGELPKEYTCDGANASPPLNWANVPTGTKSLAVTMHHVVGPTPGMPGQFDKHVYLVLYNIPATATSIAKNVAGVGLFGINTVNSKNSYSPPCSKDTTPKAYILTVYALSAEPAFSVAQSAVSMDVLLSAISKTTLGTATMTITYARSAQ